MNLLLRKIKSTFIITITVFRYILSFKFKALKEYIQIFFEGKSDKKRYKNLFKKFNKSLISKQQDLRYIIYYNNFQSKYSQIFESFGSNKGGKWKHRNNIIRHFYADFYQEILEHIEVKNLLEIGIGHSISSSGSSLRSWSKIFPNANIFGADIEKDVLFSEGNIKTFYLDQLNLDTFDEFKKKINGVKFDVIIDDGLHTFEANTNVFNKLYELLDDNGVFVIEDINHSSFPKYYDFFKEKDCQFKIIDIINFNYPIGNGLVVIKK